jgi:hypothetical protein
MALNPNEPFGLPSGSIRALIAMAVTTVTLYLFATGAVVPEALIAVNGLIIGNYFGSRGQDNAVQSVIAAMAPVDEAVAAPFIPDEIAQ